jgi:phosphate starvation-inducible PhoH-like protein
MSRRKARYAQEESGFKPRKLVARTDNQAHFIKTIKDHDIVLCSGPAGTGKTHVAVGTAVSAFRKTGVDRIVLSRPVVGVGTDIGYLPGTLEDKIGPYLVPLFDELNYCVERKRLSAMLAEKQLEIVPLSMMRGRTFNDSYVILDEAQNATMAELRMLLTRLGQNSTMIVVGDLFQSDLPRSDQGAFRKLLERLDDLEGVGICRLTPRDIVRHHLISSIEERLCLTSQPDSQNLSCENMPPDLYHGGQSDTLPTNVPTPD